MFNGIVETTGSIETIIDNNDCKLITIKPNKFFGDVEVNDSIAVNGVCLTVIQKQINLFAVTMVPETLRVTNLKTLKVGSLVNLERSLANHARVSGHFVQGHVDGYGKILDIQKEGDALLVKISNPKSLAKYIVNKGYIALDGMSITVIRSEPEWFTVTLIPHTQQITIVNQYQVGTEINIEVDMLGKYIEKLLAGQHDTSTH